MIINGKELDDAKLAAARDIFDSNRSLRVTKGRLSFDEIIDRLANDCNSLAAIGEEHGVTREMMRVTYNRYFRDVFPGRKSGRRRRHICALKRSKVVEQDFSISDVEDWVKAIATTALENNLSVRRCRYRGPRRKLCSRAFKKRELLINNRRCELRCVKHSNAFGPCSKRCYTQVSIGNKLACDFLIVRQELKESRTFIIPRKVLRKLNGSSFYLPVERGLAIHRCTINWWQYEEAWDLLRA